MNGSSQRVPGIAADTNATTAELPLSAVFVLLVPVIWLPSGRTLTRMTVQPADSHNATIATPRTGTLRPRHVSIHAPSALDRQEVHPDGSGPDLLAERHAIAAGRAEMNARVHTGI